MRMKSIHPWLLAGLALFHGSALAKESAFFAPPAGSVRIEEATSSIPNDARALVIVDVRLHSLIAPALHEYVSAAAGRRKFRIAVLPIPGLDDCPPPKLREALQAWHAVRPGIEGILFVGNIKLPSFFMPRPDIHSTRLWPRFYEDLDMTPSQTIPPGTVLKDDPAAAQSWPRVAGVKTLTVREHDFDFLEHGTPLFQHLYSGGYLGMAHLLRLRQADKDVQGNPMNLREFQEILTGDPFADAK